MIKWCVRIFNPVWQLPYFSLLIDTILCVATLGTSFLHILYIKTACRGKNLDCPARRTGIPPIRRADM
ncbi:hypothetical protein ANACOL_02276 [Anaerotruncus colihominis DSM 17241]|uniref:Uncharacterized protein n=1 Tax=Anaerotruncus colihominis DSM 17241 TaxID=445972 RepID=B0PBW8_9FIRM|nr:hypothetical protein ANACOL_02276 [Anaerotruncus colihominis DSM 17241]